MADKTATIRERAEAATRAAWHQQSTELGEQLQLLVGQFAKDGAFASTAHLAASCKACAAAVPDLTAAAWEAVSQAYKSVGAPRRVDPWSVLEPILSELRRDLLGLQGERTRTIRERLANKAMISPVLRQVDDAFDVHVVKYKAEAAMLRDAAARAWHLEIRDVIRNHGTAFLVSVIAALVVLALTAYYWPT